MAYDSVRQVTVVFGGADEQHVLGDTWEWNGRHWRKVNSLGPAPRTFPAMTFDDARGVTLLFGGNPVLFGAKNSDPKLFGDFWKWDGKQWERLDGGPPARAEASLAFDSKRKHAVLFGGYERVNGERRALGDTWEWDGERWTLVSTSGPSPRNGASMTYDRQRAECVLFGGPVISGAGFETWEWNGVDWRRSGAKTDQGRYNPAITYDENRQQTIRFGGWDGQRRTNDTWAFDGSQWCRLLVAAPAARNHAALVYDSHRKRIVLFGGHDGDDVMGDLWEWDGRNWTKRTSLPPRKRIDNNH